MSSGRVGHEQSKHRQPQGEQQRRRDPSASQSTPWRHSAPLVPTRPRSVAGHGQSALHTINLRCHYVCGQPFTVRRHEIGRWITNTPSAGLRPASTATIVAFPSMQARLRWVAYTAV